MQDIADVLMNWSEEDRINPRACESLAQRLRAAHEREMKRCIQVDNVLVSNTAMMLDDHIKALVAEAKRSAIEEALEILKGRIPPLNSAYQKPTQPKTV